MKLRALGWAANGEIKSEVVKRGAVVDDAYVLAMAAENCAGSVLEPDEGVTAETHYRDIAGDAWALRPALPDLSPMTANVSVALGFPAGSAVVVEATPEGVVPPGGEFVTNAASTLALPAGLWTIRVNPPFPYIAQDFVVEVAE